MGFAVNCGFLLASVGVLAQLLLSLVPRLHPVVELACHFSMHSMVALCLLVPTAIYRGKRGWAIVLSAATLLALAITQPWELLPQKTSSATQHKHAISILSWNVLASNQAHDEIRQIVAEADTDIVLLIEASPAHIRGLADVLNRYPHTITYPAWGGSGIALLSKVPVAKLELEPFTLAHQPAIIASLSLADSSQNLTLIAMHTVSPIPVWRTSYRDAQLAAMREWSLAQPGPLCLFGDLNVTPWAPSFRELIDAGFKDSRQGNGNCASWPASAGMLGIPIDHALTLGDCGIVDRQVLSGSRGSDHRPIRFELRY